MREKDSLNRQKIFAKDQITQGLKEAKAALKSGKVLSKDVFESIQNEAVVVYSLQNTGFDMKRGIAKMQILRGSLVTKTLGWASKLEAMKSIITQYDK